MNQEDAEEALKGIELTELAKKSDLECHAFIPSDYLTN